MKTLLLSIFALSVSAPAHAYTQCYRFDVSKHSNGLGFIQMKVNGTQKAGLKDATVLAKKSETRWTLTRFQCADVFGINTCSEKNGAGDFSISMRNNKPVLKLIYLNLVIGSQGSVRIAPGQVVTEEFAIYDIQHGNEEDEDGSGEMTKQVVIEGEVIPCRRTRASSN